MSEQENIAVVKRMFEAFAQGDLEAVLSYCSNDVAVQHPMPTAIWPWAGSFRGRAKLKEFLLGVTAAETFEVFEAREFIAQGNKVVVNVFERPRMKTTGKAFNNDYIQVYTLSEGLITSIKIFEDTGLVISAMHPD